MRGTWNHALHSESGHEREHRTRPAGEENRWAQLKDKPLVTGLA
jgi:hypothetical protein